MNSYEFPCLRSHSLQSSLNRMDSSAANWLVAQCDSPRVFLEEQEDWIWSLLSSTDLPIKFRKSSEWIKPNEADSFASVRSRMRDNSAEIEPDYLIRFLFLSLFFYEHVSRVFWRTFGWSAFCDLASSLPVVESLKFRSGLLSSSGSE